MRRGSQGFDCAWSGIHCAGNVVDGKAIVVEER